MTTLILHNLAIGYKTKTKAYKLLSNINECVPSGTLICLCGPNGGGKSTLLKTLCGFIKPLEGHITINQIRLNELSPEKKARLIGIVLSYQGKFNAMKAIDLVGLGRVPYTGFFGRLSKHDKMIIRNVMERIGITHLENRLVNSLSDGERQKVMIAKTLAQDTEIILLDEPTAFLDYPSKVDIMMLLKDLCQNEGKTIFISTHDLDIAFSITDYVWLIDKNLGLKTGDISQLGHEGTIDRYFQQDGLRFNPTTKHFQININ